MHTGVASDALKVAEYREVLRMRREIQARDPGAFQFMRQLGSGMSPYANFSRILSKVAAAHVHRPTLSPLLIWGLTLV